MIQLLATSLLVAATVSAAFAEDAYYHDTQWFSPVELDFNSRPIRKSSGYFFRYDRLNWAATGERVSIGDNSLNVLSEQIFRDTPQAEGTAPAQYPIINGIQDGPPWAEFGWGARYELGSFDGENGWLIGILDGPAMTSSANYGYGSASIPPAGADVGTFDHAGFGSVHVNFATPPDFLLGFRDYHTNGENNEQNPTNNGPHIRISTAADAYIQVTQIVPGAVTNTGGGGAEPGQTFIENPNANPETATKLADGIIDDLDGDGITIGVVFVLDADGEPTDVVQGTIIDFEDLHLFNIRFDTLHVRNTTETKGVEVMRTYDLSNRHLPVKRQDDRLNIAYGVRFLMLDDRFYWEGQGGILGRSFTSTDVENQIVGPQVRATWQSQIMNRLNLHVDGRFMFGYNIQDLDQVGAIGKNLIPGGPNSLISGQPTAFSYGRRDDSFTPVIEFRAEGSYQLTSAIALKLGYTAVFVDNITRAAESVRWYLPDMGLLSSGDQDILINGATFGVEFVH